MGLFKKKHKVEQIDIPLEQPEEDVKEEVKKQEDEINLPASIEEVITLIDKEFSRLAKGYDNLLYNYYMCKFFSIAVLKDEEDYIDMASLEKQMASIRELYEDIDARVKNLKEEKDYADNYLKQLYQDIKHGYEIYLGLSSRVNETRRNKYNSIKISSLAAIINKTGEELEKMDKRFMLFLNSFKSLEEASDYIYVNSGELITNLVNSLVRCSQTANKKEYQNLFNIYYFLKSDVILCLSLSEWVELYNKIRHCVNVLRGVDVANYIDFQNYLDEFEIRYLLLMINEEKKNMLLGGKNEKNS